MKHVLLFIILTLNGHVVAGTMTLAMLETFSSAGSQLGKDRSSMTSDDQLKATVFGSYMMGFFDGVEQSSIMFSNKESRKDQAAALSTIPDWMKDPAQSGPSVLAFIRRHTPQGVDTSTLPAAPMVHAWFVHTHPEAGITQRLGAYMSLGLLYQWGPDFPGAKELRERAGDNYEPQKKPEPVQK